MARTAPIFMNARNITGKHVVIHYAGKSDGDDDDEYHSHQNVIHTKLIGLTLNVMMH